MSDKAKKYLLDISFDDAHLPKLFNDDDKSYYTIPELMQSYADQHLKDVLEEEESKIKLMPEYQVLQNPTDYDYRDVENARKIVNTTKWLLNHLKQIK